MKFNLYRCKQTNKLYDEYKNLSEKYNCVSFYVLDCDIRKEICYREKITGIPCYKLYLNEKCVKFIKGPVDINFSLEDIIKTFRNTIKIEDETYIKWIDHTKKLLKVFI